MIYPSQGYNWSLSLDGEIFKDVGMSIKSSEGCCLLQFTGCRDIEGSDIYEGIYY